MLYDAESFIERAEECVKLAHAAKDDLIRKELLQLRQSYLQTADRLKKINKTKGKD